MRYPVPFVDEAWLTSRAWAYMHTGHQLGQLDMGVANLFPSGWIVNQWLITFLQSLALRLAGSPSLLAMRIVSLAWGFLLLVACYFFFKHLIGKPAALISTLLLAGTTAFFYSAHSARYDIMAAALAYLGCLLVFTGKPERFWQGLLAGFLLCMAVETHLNSLIFILTVLIMLVMEYRLRLVKLPLFWGFVAGGVLGVLYYLVLHVFPNPNTFFTLNNLIMQSGYAPAFTMIDLSYWVKTLQDMGNLIFAACTTAVILLPFGLCRIYTKPDKLPRKLAAFLLILLALFLVVVRKKTYFYAILLTPAMCGVIGYFICSVFTSPIKNRLVWVFSRVFIIASVVGMLALTGYQLQYNGFDYYRAAQAKIDPYIQPTDRIMGSQNWWMGQPDHTYFSWELIYSYPQVEPTATLADTMAALKPDLFITDRLMLLVLESKDPAQPDGLISKQELLDYLHQHGTLIASLDSPYYGPFEIYRLQWKH
jgi:hypothetical protein